MIILPSRPNRRELRGFWGIVSLGVGGLVIVLMPWDGPRAWLVAAGAFLAASLPGWFRPRWVESVYELWNRTAGLAGRAGARWVSMVAFYALVVPVGQAGSRMPWTGPEGSATGWAPRSGRISSLAAQHRGARGETSEVPWYRSLVGWARDSGNYWALGLVPLLGLLRLLRPKTERSLGENIYTLY